MTRAQRKAIERLKKKHRCNVVTREGVSQSGALIGENVELVLLCDELPEDERVKLVRPSGLVEEPADIGGLA